ncbi:MAG: hypothetical protein ABIL58_25040 [Pseudomonadota bacterium]
MDKTRKSIKVELLRKFRDLSEDDQFCLPGLWLELGYKQSLNKAETATFQQAVRELIRSGIVEPHEGVFDTICLTDKGAALLFS